MTTQVRNQIVTTVGQNLRAARVERNLTQKQVGDALGVTNRDVSRWEGGKVEPGPVYRQMLADLFYDGEISRMYELSDETKAAA
jgi:transcriptional regulator with XRE-family HTH domain